MVINKSQFISQYCHSAIGAYCRPDTGFKTKRNISINRLLNDNYAQSGTSTGRLSVDGQVLRSFRSLLQS